jgi:uncharacterized membrane protein
VLAQLRKLLRVAVVAIQFLALSHQMVVAAVEVRKLLLMATAVALAAVVLLTQVEH